ncbi:MAG: hypothetical protein IJJ33_07405 [Victivallales bacterium]|nr:hypothetical protein [Victivallales bacterium]
MKHPVLRFLLLVFIFLLFSLPFKAMSLIPGFTNVRPVDALGPIYAVFYGPIGCLAIACGNLISDVIDDALRWSSLAGFSANFLGPFLVWLFWHRWAKHPFALRNIRQLLIHTALLGAVAILECAIITPAVAIAYPDVNASFFACCVLFNTSFFPIFLSIPMTILMQEELGFRFFRNPSEPMPKNVASSPSATEDKL